MAHELSAYLSRRERQVMDVIYRLGEATVSEVIAGIPDPPTNPAVRAVLRTLEEKGELTHDQRGARYVYRPVVPRRSASRTALRRLVDTFFDGSPEKALVALLDLSTPEISQAEIDRISALIEWTAHQGAER